MEPAELAGIAGGIGGAAVLLAAGRWTFLAGLALLSLAEIVLVLEAAGRSSISPALVALGVAGLVPLAVGGAVFVRWPAAVLPAILAVAPFRPPLSFGGENRYFVGVAGEGQLGRLLFLYGVLGAAVAALAWSALRGRDVPALPRLVAVPGAAFLLLAGASLLWTSDVTHGATTLAYFLLPFALLLAVAGRAPYPPWMTRALAYVAIALAALFAAVGLWQAATGEVFFFSPSVEVGNAFSSFFRVTSLFRDPSLYGRHVVLGIAIVLVALLRRRVNPLLAAAVVAFLFAGLYFSYSQSSMAALFVVTVALAAVAADRSLRLVAAVTAVVVALAGAGYVVASTSDHSARRVTSDRSRRVESTFEVFRDRPLAGVGLGAQAKESQRRSPQGGSPTRFVSHTTPLTVAAELGILGLAAYVALLAGAAVLIERVRRLDLTLGLGLGAVLLALVVHSLAYSGFFEDPVTWFVMAAACAYLLSRRGAILDA